jgi:hypothetical protein
MAAPIMTETVLSYTVMPLKPDVPDIDVMIAPMVEQIPELSKMPGVSAGTGGYLLLAKAAEELVIQAWYLEPGSTFETITGNQDRAMAVMGSIKEHASGPPKRGPAEGIQMWFPAVPIEAHKPTPFIFTRVLFEPKPDTTKEMVMDRFRELSEDLMKVCTDIGDIFCLRCVWNAAAGNYEVGGCYKTKEAAEAFTDKAHASIGKLAGFATGPPTSRVFCPESRIFGRL